MNADSSHPETVSLPAGEPVAHPGNVTTRFQIEELVLQDSSGVVFRALDTQTGNTVAIRRFFPFGIDGGGMIQEEQTSYGRIIDRLTGLHHPALRSVVTGGCDPVDGVPFMITEWIEGEELGSFIGKSMLSDEAATHLIRQAMEVCELISHVLAEEAVWAEIDLQTIIVGNPESGREFIFWISPFKCVRGSTETRGLEEIITLTEQAMSSTGHTIRDHAETALGKWLKWLREHAATATLHDASEWFASFVGATPPPPVTQFLATAESPPATQWLTTAESPPVTQWLTTAEAPPAATSSKIPLRSSLVLCVVVIAGLVISWLVSLKSAAPSENTNNRTTQADPQIPGTLIDPIPANLRAGEAISWSDHKRLVANDNQPVTIEGVVKDITKSSTGKTIYLLFTTEENKDAARVGIEIGESPADPVIKKLRRYVGKKIRVSGKVTLQKLSGRNRPDIIIKKISAVKTVK